MSNCFYLVVSGAPSLVTLEMVSERYENREEAMEYAKKQAKSYPGTEYYVLKTETYWVAEEPEPMAYSVVCQSGIKL